MTPQELERIKNYNHRIQAAGGNTGVLEDNERQDLEELVRKRLQESESEKD